MSPRARKTWVLRTLSRLWAPICILFFVFAWSEQTYHLIIGDNDGVPLLVGGWFILTTIIVVYGVLSYFIERSFAQSQHDPRAKYPTDEAGAPIMPSDTLQIKHAGLTSFQGLAQRIAGILAFVAGSYAFVRMWNPEADVMSESLADRSLGVIVIIFLGYIAYNAFRIWIDKKIEEMKVLQATIEQSITTYDEQQAAKMASLVKIYENMKPKDAARIFEELDMDTLLLVAERMKERSLAPIMANMDPGRARDITVDLSRRRQLPQEDAVAGG